VAQSTIPFNLPAASVDTSSAGEFKFTFVAPSGTGLAVIDLNMAGVTSSVTINIQSPPDAGATIADAGSPEPTTILFLSATPTTRALNVKGTGTDHGSFTFKVLDQYQNPYTGALVDFAVSQPHLVTLVNSDAVSSGGIASVNFNALILPGVTSINAYLDADPTIATTQTVTVHSGLPAWQNFQFYCDQRNLPVYTLTTNTMGIKCHVQLGDRYGNVVDSSPTINFYSEAGTFTPGSVVASATGGVADVTFTAAPTPVDVLPFVEDQDQYPVALINDEPLSTVNFLQSNPRDQLVTIIAVTQGEEQLDEGSGSFTDLSDPFIDVNDDNLLDSTNGHSESRICTAPYADGGCTPFSYGNGQWDSSTTIWVQRKLVFTGASTATSVNLSGQFAPSGAAGVGYGYVYDSFLNLPAPGTTMGVSNCPTGCTCHVSPSPWGDTYGSTEVLSNNTTFGITTVAESDGGACDASNGLACVPKFVVNDFATDPRVTVTATGTNCAPSGVVGVKVTSPAVTGFPQIVTEGSINYGP